MVIRKSHIGKLAALLMFGIIILFAGQPVFAQEKPPRPIAIYVSTVQHLNFGDIVLGPTGGTVTVAPNGTRTSTGDITLASMGSGYSAALIEVEANRGTIITILNGPDATLTGSNGGSMTMHIGSSLPVSPFVTSNHYPNRTLVYIGGTLTVGNASANPEGSYSGTFSITFIQE